MPLLEAPSRPDRRVLRSAFVVVLVFWLAVPVLQLHLFTNDAVAYFAGAAVAREAPDDVYPSAGRIYEPSARFGDEVCRRGGADIDCFQSQLSFVSPPTSLLPSWLPAQLDTTVGSLLFRLAMALAFAGGMVAIWNHLVPRSDAASWVVLACAVVITPSVMVPLRLGQSSPLLFLLAAWAVPRRPPPAADGTSGGSTSLGSTSRGSTSLGSTSLGSTSLGSEVGRGIVVALAGAFKGFPLAMLGVALFQRRFRLVVSGVVATAVLAVGGLAIGPAWLYGRYLEVLGPLERDALGLLTNASVPALFYRLGVPDGGGRLVSVLLLVASVGLLVVVARRAEPAVVWSLAALLLLVVSSVVWLHYLVVAVPAALYAWGMAPTNRRAAFPLALCGALFLLTLPSVPTEALATVQVVLLLGAVAGVVACVLTSPRRPSPVPV